MVAAGVAPEPVPMPAAAAARAAAAVAAARQRRWLQWRRQRWRTCRRCGCKRLLVAMVLGCSCWAPLCRFVSVLVRSSYFSSLLVMYTHTPYYLMPHAVRARPGASQLFRSTLLSCCYPAALPAARCLYTACCSRGSRVGGQEVRCGPAWASLGVAVGREGRGARRAGSDETCTRASRRWFLVTWEICID
jgi:hypothetical protein